MSLLITGIFIGSIVGYFLCRWDTEERMKDLQAEKRETDLVWAEHNATHVCVLKPKEEEWPEDVSFQ
jgi:hypothetical protein